MSHLGLRAEVRRFLAQAQVSGAFVPHCDAWMTCFDGKP